MSESLPDVEVTNPTPEDYFELQNPREETAFGKYYNDLDCEELLHVYQYSDPKIYGKILENTNGIDEYNTGQDRVNLIRKSHLKEPFFRKIKQTTVPTPASTSNISTQYLEKIGFFNANEEKYKNINLPNTYLRPKLDRNELPRGKLMLNSKAFQVYYDMDETDNKFLSWLNEVAGKDSKVSMEQFEITISFFETKLYHIERVLPPTIKNRSVIDYQQQQHAFLYGSDDGTGCQNQDEQACAVCDISECDSTNSIVFCDGCDIAVHQDCYGVSFIPEGPWLCRRCLIARNVKEPCMFCPSTTGAFKQTDSGDWAHALCALWMPELYFANPIYMEPVEGVSNIPKSRWRLICYICKQKGGACIQCSKPSCFSAYHVTCAKRAGFYMKYKKGVKKAVNDKASMVSYCDKHTTIEWGMTHDIKSGIDKTRMYFHDKTRNGDSMETNFGCGNLTFVTNEENQEIKQSQSEKFKWRLDSSIYVIPQIIVNQLIQFFTDNKLPQISETMICQIAKYYTLKRQYLGKPLIKHPDILNHASLTEETLDSRKEAVDYLIKDVGKLQEMSKLTLKRSKIEKEYIENKLETSLMVHDLKTYILRTLVSYFENHFLESPNDYQPSSIPKYAVKPSIYEIIKKIELSLYKDVDSVIIDIEKFSDWINTTNFNLKSPLIPLQKLFRTWQRYKKNKYAAAQEQFQQIENLTSLGTDMILGNGLEMRIPEISSNENIKNPTRIRKRNTSKRMGIDITQFDKIESNDNGRSLRTRKTVSPNAEDTSNKLRARLNRVKERTTAQSLRGSRSRS